MKIYNINNQEIDKLFLYNFSKLKTNEFINIKKEYFKIELESDIEAYIRVFISDIFDYVKKEVKQILHYSFKEKFDNSFFNSKIENGLFEMINFGVYDSLENREDIYISDDEEIRVYQ